MVPQIKEDFFFLVEQIKEGFMIFEIINELWYLIHVFLLISEMSQTSDAFCRFSSYVLVTFPFINIFYLTLLFDFSYLVIRSPYK